MGKFVHRLVHGGKWVWTASALCLLLAAVALPFDHAVTDWVRGMTGGHTGQLVRLVGGFGHGLTVSVIFVVLLVLYGEERVGIQGLMGGLGAGIATDVLKVIIGRQRPDGSSDSFPSGHSACAFATAFVLARRWPRLRYVFYLGAAGVAAARVLWLRHFPSDVLAGAAVGMVFGLAATALVDGMTLLEKPHAMLRVKVVLATLLVATLCVAHSWPQPLGRLAPPFLLLLVIHRAVVFLRARQACGQAPISGDTPTSPPGE